MPKINIIDRDGEAHQIDAETGASLMQNLVNAGLPVAAICGGVCSCGTCHVFVPEDFAGKAGNTEMSSDEEGLVSMLVHYDEERSRLSCQLTVSDAFQNLVFTLAPEE